MNDIVISGYFESGFEGVGSGSGPDLSNPIHCQSIGSKTGMYYLLNRNSSPSGPLGPISCQIVPNRPSTS